MAAPAEITIQDLNGKFVMDKTLSHNPDEVMKLQEISWLTRKAIGLATITLAITESEKPSESDPSKTVTHVDIAQTATGGIPGTAEARVLDFQQRPHTDHIFGSVKGRTRWVRGSKGPDGKVRPDVDVQTKVGGDGAEDLAIAKFLKGETVAEGTPSEGWLVEKVTGVLATEEGTDPENGIWLQSWVEADAGWTAEQIWGFQIIDGVRYYSRNVVVAKGSTVQKVRLVYTFLGRE